MENFLASWLLLSWIVIFVLIISTVTFSNKAIKLEKINREQFESITDHIKYTRLLEDKLETAKQTLESISKNSCCDSCQEAAKVAVAGLKKIEEIKTPTKFSVLLDRVFGLKGSPEMILNDKENLEIIEEQKKYIQSQDGDINLMQAKLDEYGVANAKLNIILYHREDGLSCIDPDIQLPIVASKLLEAEKELAGYYEHETELNDDIKLLQEKIDQLEYALAEAEQYCKENKQEIEPDAIHNWFSLSYAQYLTIPRTVLQSMPDQWQGRLVQCLREMNDTFDWMPEEDVYRCGLWIVDEEKRLDEESDAYWVTEIPDPLADYERGRRKLTPEPKE